MTLENDVSCVQISINKVASRLMRGMLGVNGNGIDFVQHSNESHIESLGTMGSNWQRLSERNLEEACAECPINNVRPDGGMVTHLEPALSWPGSSPATCRPARQ